MIRLMPLGDLVVLLVSLVQEYQALSTTTKPALFEPFLLISAKVVVV